MSKVYVFLAEGFEEIEGLTVVDLLRRANIETEMVSVMEGKQIKGSHGIKVTADSMFADVDFSDADLLVLPGGMPGTLNLGNHEGLCELLKKQYAEEKDIPCYVSLEERMACGVGACLACVCKTKDVDHHSNVHNARICKDGPVFLATEVEL